MQVIVLLLLICALTSVDLAAAERSASLASKVARILVKTEWMLDQAETRAHICDPSAVANWELKACAWALYEDLFSALDMLVSDGAALMRSPADRQFREAHERWKEWSEAEVHLYIEFSTGRGTGAELYALDDEGFPRMKKKIPEMQRYLLRYFQKTRGIPPETMQRELAAARLMRDSAQKLCPSVEVDEGPFGTPEGCARAVEIYRDLFGEDHLAVAHARDLRGVFLTNAGRPEEAVKEHELAMAIFEKKEEPPDLDLAATLAMIGDALFRQKKYGQAIGYYQRSLARYDIVEKRDKHPGESYEAHYGLNDIAQKNLLTVALLNKGAGLAEYYAEAKRRCERWAGEGGYCDAVLHHVIGEAHLENGDIARAREEYRLALETIMQYYLYKLKEKRIPGALYYGWDLPYYQGYLDDYRAVANDPGLCPTVNGYRLLWRAHPMEMAIFFYRGFDARDLYDEQCRRGVPGVEELSVYERADICSCPQ